MTIVLDLDDVLANLRESLYQTMHRATGIDNHWRNWSHYDLRQHFDIDDDTLDAVLMREQALESCQPEPEAAATTQRLAELGFELTIVTARGWHPRAYDLTAEWLDHHGIHHDYLRVVPLGSNKLTALQAFEQIVLAVDDHPRNVDHFQTAGIPTLMMDMPWNADHQGAQRIHSLTAVVDYVDALSEE